jgi:nucleotide-binding universal stress UspA family protein
MAVVVGVDGAGRSVTAIRLAVVQTATHAGAELLVLATRGSVSLLPGTVSQYALRNAPCPVLVVPEGAGHQQ